MAKVPTIIQQLQSAIERSGKTRYRISMDTGIDESSLSKFVNHGWGLSPKNIEKVCECIGVRFVLRPVRRRKSKGR
jgi:hypothetical protein